MQVEFLVCLVLAVVVVHSEIILGTPGLHFNQNAEYAASYDNYQPRDYAFDYAVSDPHTGDHKSQWEIKEKGVVRGSYSLLEPDGTTRIVEYVADDLGFRAVVKKIGHSLHPGGIAIQSVEAHGIPSAPAVVATAAPVAVVHQPDVQTFSAYDGHVQNYANVAVQPIEIPQTVQYQAPSVVAQQAPIYAQHIQTPVIAKVQPQLYQNVQPVVQEQVSYQAQPIQLAYAQPIQQAYAQPIQQAYAQPIQQAYAQPIQQAYAQPIQQSQVYAQPIQQSQVYAQQIQQSQAYAQPIQQSQVYAQPIVKEQVYQNIQAHQPIQQYVQAEQVLQEQAYAQPAYQNIEQYPQAVLAHAAQSTQNQLQLPSADYGLQSHHQQQLVPVSQPRYVETSSQIHGLTGNLDDDSRYSNDGYQQQNVLQQGGYDLSIPLGDYQGGYGIESPRSYRNALSKRSKSPQPFLIKV